MTKKKTNKKAIVKSNKSIALIFANNLKTQPVCNHIPPAPAEIIMFEAVNRPYRKVDYSIKMNLYILKVDLKMNKLIHLNTCIRA